jgi:hypothetical protein
MRHALTTPFVVLFIVLTPSFTSAQSSSSLGKESLRGLKGVYVLVEPFDPEVEAAGLWKTQIQTDTELKLRKVGIRVASESESANPAFGTLYINVATHALKGSNANLFAFDIVIEVDQQVQLIRRGPASPALPAATYQVAGGVGTVGVNHLRDDLRGSISDKIDVFLNDYLAMNPKP